MSNGPASRRKLAAIMFTDIVGFSKLAQRAESVALRLLEDHQAMVRGVYPNHGGREVKTIGDAFMLEFSSALDAVECAVAIQKGQHESNAASTDGEIMQARIGIHVGDVVERAGDLFGDGVNIAARVEPLAPPEGVVVSQQVYDQIVNKLELTLRKMSTQKMKNIERTVELFQVVMPWETEVPPLEQEVPPEVVSLEAEIPAVERVEPAAAGAPELDRTRVAVLPFVSARGEDQDEFISDGMTEELIVALSSMARIKMISWTSCAQYRGTDKDVRAIGEELRAGSILRGSVGVSAGRIDLNLELLDSASQSSVWTKAYSADIRDTGALFLAVAKDLAGSLKMELHEWEVARVQRQGTGSPQAKIFYLKGRASLGKYGFDEVQNANDCFMRALNYDPDYVMALVGLAEGYNFLGLQGRIPPNQLAMHIIPGAASSSRKALERDPFLAEAHAAMAQTSLIFSYDVTSAQRHLKQAIEFKSGCALARRWHALALAVTGRFEECMVELQHAGIFDPLSPATILVRVLVRFMSREYGLVIEESRSALGLHPDLWPVALLMGASQEAVGNSAEAIADLVKAREISGNNPLAMAGHAHALAAADRKEEARKVLGELEELSQRRHVSSCCFAIVHLGLAENEKALARLEQAYDEQISWLMFFGPAFILDPIRSDPRFEALYQKTGLTSFTALSAASLE